MKQQLQELLKNIKPNTTSNKNLSNHMSPYYQAIKKLLQRRIKKMFFSYWKQAKVFFPAVLSCQLQKIIFQNAQKMVVPNYIFFCKTDEMRVF